MSQEHLAAVRRAYEVAYAERSVANVLDGERYDTWNKAVGASAPRSW